MKEFLGKLSIAEAIGEIYQNKVRLIVSVCGFIGLIVSVCGFIGVSGIIAIQFKVAGLVFEHKIPVEETVILYT
jgi:hypothetical protein